MKFKQQVIEQINKLTGEAEYLAILKSIFYRVLLFKDTPNNILTGLDIAKNMLSALLLPMLEVRVRCEKYLEMAEQDAKKDTKPIIKELALQMRLAFAIMTSEDEVKKTNFKTLCREIYKWASSQYANACSQFKMADTQESPETPSSKKIKFTP